jgi:hypothetical protein
LNQFPSQLPPNLVHFDLFRNSSTSISFTTLSSLTRLEFLDLSLRIKSHYFPHKLVFPHQHLNSFSNLMCLNVPRNNLILISFCYFVGSVSKIIQPISLKWDFCSGKILWNSQWSLQNSFQHWITCFDGNGRSTNSSDKCVILLLFLPSQKIFFVAMSYSNSVENKVINTI